MRLAPKDLLLTVPSGINGGHMNVRSGPGNNHGLIILGADWCRVTWNGLRGWVSQAGLMPEVEEEPAQSVGTGNGPNLICGAPHVLLGDDPRDNNPVVSVEVGHSPDDQAWRIFHRMANGQVISRSEQYAITDWSDAYKTQHAITYAE